MLVQHSSTLSLRLTAVKYISTAHLRIESVDGGIATLAEEEHGKRQ